MLSEKQQKIISLLQLSGKGLTGEELSRLIGVSSRTIRTYVKNAGAYLAECGAVIHSDTRSGYKLEIQSADLFRKLIKEKYVQAVSKEDRVKFIMQKLLYNALDNTQITQQQLADELFISISTLKISLKEVAKKLAEYDLEIISYKSKGMRISGNEAKIRYCIAQYIFNKKQGEHIYKDICYQRVFDDIDLHAVEKIILRVITVYEIRLTDMAVQNLLFHIAIAMKRAKEENYIVYTVSQTKMMERTNEFEVASSIFKEIYREMHVDIATSEIYYLTQHLLASKKYMDANEQPLGQTTKLVKEMLSKVNENLGIDFSQDQNLIKWLALHLKTAIPRMRFQMNIRNEVLEVIKSEYPLAFQIAIISSNVIEKKENITVNENEIGYIAIHFGSALSRLDIKSTYIKKVLLVCASGMGTVVLLQTRLEEYFRNRIKVVNTIPGYKLDKAAIDSVDIVLTTVPIEHISSDKIIQLHHLLNTDEVNLLKQKIFAANLATEPKIETFFRKDCFNVGLQFGGKKEILEFLTEQLKKKGFMSDSTKASVFEREKASPTEIGNMVAIPHPMRNDTTKSSIAILILDKPIMWEEHYVQVVFLISIAKEEFHLWEPIFLKLFKYLVKENGVKEMIRDASYESFIQKFRQQF